MLRLETKLDMLHCIEADKEASILGYVFNLGEFTVCNITNDANKICSAVTYCASLFAIRYEKLNYRKKEKMLSLYTEHEARRKIHLSNVVLKTKIVKSNYKI